MHAEAQLFDGVKTRKMWSTDEVRSRKVAQCTALRALRAAMAYNSYVTLSPPPPLLPMH